MPSANPITLKATSAVIPADDMSQPKGDLRLSIVSGVSEADLQNNAASLDEGSLLPWSRNRNRAGRYVGWLPPVTHGQQHCWLPIRADTLPVLTAWASGSSSDSMRTKCRDTLSRDPALLIFTVCQWINAVEGSNHSDEMRVSLNDLTDWWSRHGNEAWLASDGLALPTDAEEKLAQFSKLDDYFAILPPRRWLADCMLWIQAGASHVGQTLPISGVAISGAAIDSASPNGMTRVRVTDFDASVRFSETLTGAVADADAHIVLTDLARKSQRALSADLIVSGRIRDAKHDLAKQLAYGLSHEINNPLANVATRAQAIQTMTDDVQAKQSLQRIVEQSYRAHAMISDLMFYANPPEPRIRQMDLDDRIASVMEHFSSTAERLGISFSRENAFETDEDDEPKFTLLADSEMIGEAVAVLVRNSIEAIGTGGRIHIRTTTEDQVALIEVSDSGPGITAEQAFNAFDPYYSGREAGRGLGLGLCRADRIARLHGGSVTLAPAIAGCVAQMRLPITSPRVCETPH